MTLTRWLNVSAPAVTMAIKRLKRDGLIAVAGEGQINLTGAGRDIANRLLNRHHLIERMLTEIFGLEWYKVHDEAEQLEHAVSADFERKLVEKLGTGGVCPHGNRVGTDSPGERRQRGLKPLEEAAAGRAGNGDQHLRARPALARVPGWAGNRAGRAARGVGCDARHEPAGGIAAGAHRSRRGRARLGSKPLETYSVFE